MHVLSTSLLNWYAPVYIFLRQHLFNTFKFYGIIENFVLIPPQDFHEKMIAKRIQKYQSDIRSILYRLCQNPLQIKFSFLSGRRLRTRFLSDFHCFCSERRCCFHGIFRVKQTIKQSLEMLFYTIVFIHSKSTISPCYNVRIKSTPCEVPNASKCTPCSSLGVLLQYLDQNYCQCSMALIIIAKMNTNQNWRLER